MKPVFIAGCGRSGTTFLGSLLGAHSSCVTVPESQFKYDLLSEYANLSRSPAEICSFLSNHWRFRSWGLPAHVLQDVEACDSVRDMLVYLVSAYGESKLDKRGTVWVDHTPDNFDHALALTRHFPDCKFIHMVRDGRAVAASVLPLPWGPCTAEDAAGWWVRRIAVGLAAEQHFGERGQILRVYYHDLVQRPVETINRILDFLELPREEVLLSDRASFLLPEFTKPQHTLVHQAPDVGRVDAWRKVLTHRQIEFFELTAGVLLTYLGFELESRYPIRPQTNLEALRSKVKKLSRKVSDRRELARQMSMEQG